MKEVTVFFFDENRTHVQRIDATKAYLTEKEWVFEDVSIHRVGQTPSQLPRLLLTTT